MKRTLQAFAFTTLALAALGAGTPAPAPVPPPAAPGPHAGPHAGLRAAGQGGPRDRQERLAAILRLSPEQKTALKGIREQHRAGLEAKGAAARDGARAFREALRGETEPAKLKALHAAMADAEFEVMLARRAERKEIKALLTPEQRERAAFLEGMREGRDGGRGFGRRGMGGRPGMGGHPGLGGPGGPEGPRGRE
jgi:Spy/CpxP family protein refolding chaperone